jgi:hypothetical protein
MPKESSPLRALATEAEALQQRVYDAVSEATELTPDQSFRLGEAFASLGSAAQTLKAAADEAAPA